MEELIFPSFCVFSPCDLYDLLYTEEHLMSQLYHTVGSGYAG